MRDTGIKSIEPSISIILPVYRNLAVTRACIESIFQHPLPAGTSLTVINDGSPEDALVKYCLAASDKYQFEFINNSDNAGFVKTANEGMSLNPGADVILLNSDTVVAHNWVERLRRCAYAEDSIGTVTPFSNSGTICSYPIFPLSNPLPTGWTAAQMDAITEQANHEKHHEIPTAVGFCMYVKRSCIEETGLFDEEKFGLGYGEECDFSLRAAAKGWKHVLAGDVFVYHEGAASFSSESDDRKERADAIMARLHPHYDEMITAFIQKDPLADLRQNIDFARIRERATDLPSIFSEHARYQSSLLERIARERANFRKAQSENAELESLLTQTREAFGKTDSALSAAHDAIARLEQNFADLQQQAQNLQTEMERVSSELHVRTDERQELLNRLEQIHNSKSWRYTRFLRREESNS